MDSSVMLSGAQDAAKRGTTQSLNLIPAGGLFRRSGVARTCRACLTRARLVQRVLRADVARLEGTARAGDQLLDAQLGITKQLFAASLEVNAALVEGDGQFQCLAAGLELGDRPL